MINPINLITKQIYQKPSFTSTDSLLAAKAGMTEEDRLLLRRLGVTGNELGKAFYESSMINFERTGLYREIERSLLHPLMASGLELYSDVATTYNSLQNATVWATGDGKYVDEIEKLFERIGLEERISDWSYTIGGYGDLFAELIAEPATGIIAVNDDAHPINLSRLDYNGALVGFFDTPVAGVAEMSDSGHQLYEPWKYVHFRLLGVKKRRSSTADPNGSTEYRTAYLMSQDTKQVSSKYGTSLLLNGLPIYKRLRLTEDSLLMARLTRGPERWIYKLKVDGSNSEAVVELLESYKSILKKARAIDTTGENSSGAGYFDSKFSPLSALEDVLIPVWGDVGDLDIQSIGGKPDIKWIADIEELRNQLACAIRVPLSLLGGYVKEASGSLGAEALEKLDIRFARSARRLQRSLISGITRMCQLHFAYMGMNPSLDFFQIQMAETSNAEEESLKESLETGTDIIGKFMDMLSDIDKNIDKKAIFNYLNEKILKLNDFDLNDFLTMQNIGEKDQSNVKDMLLTETVKKQKGTLKQKKSRLIRENNDLAGYLPSDSTDWKKKFGDTKVQFKVK